MKAGARPARRSAVASSGISSTTSGVSLTKPDIAAAPTSTTSSASQGARATSHASWRAAGSSAPVSTSERPRIISEQIATSAGWPKPPKKR